MKIEDARDNYFGRMMGELCYAEQKHNSWPGDSIHASAILTEEAGKLTQACNDYMYGNGQEEQNLERMQEKVLRVAAMALRFYNVMPAAHPRVAE